MPLPTIPAAKAKRVEEGKAEALGRTSGRVAGREEVFNFSVINSLWRIGYN